MPMFKMMCMLCAGLVGLLGVAGCGDGGGGSGDAKAIAVLVPAPTHGWTKGVNWWVDKTINEYKEKNADVEWIYQTAKSGTEQGKQVESLINQGVNAIVILPFDSTGPLSAVKKAKEKGIYIVSVDRGLDDPIADVYLAGDNRSFGRKSAEWMAEKLDGTGKILIFRGQPSVIDNERYEGAMGVFDEHEGIEVLASQNADWNRSKAQQVMEAWLQQYDEIDAVWASDDDMALGIEKAIKAAGREDEMWVFGGAGMQEIVKRIKDNDRLIVADITYPPGMIAAGIHLGYAAVALGGDEKAVADDIPGHLGVDTSKLLAKDAERPEVQREIFLEMKLITPENAEQFVIEGSPF